jgi:hypothetical protein
MHDWMYRNFPDWDHLDPEKTLAYNRVVEEVAREKGAILADIWSAEEGVDWFVDPDHCHANDLGHFVIANKVFEAIARNCSFVARNMPRETLINKFRQRFGNGPDLPDGREPTVDAVAKLHEGK